MLTKIRTVCFALALGLLAGCQAEEAGENPYVRLYRVNQELQQQVAAQERVIHMMSLALIVLGAALAVTLGILIMRKGGRSSHPPSRNEEAC